MMDLQVVGDLAGQWTEAVSSVSAGLSGIGVDRYSDSLEKMIGALDLMTGSMAIVGAVKSAVEMWNGYKAMLAAAETAANVAMGPIGWSKIALAAGVAAVTATTLFSLTDYVLEANLSNESEVTAVTQTIGGIL